jgi:hypothetical protein
VIAWQNAGQVCRRAAGDQVAVNADFLLYDGGASVAKVGAHAGIRRERAIPDYVGSTRVHGPCQMAATGLPDRTKSRTKATADSSSRNLSGLTVPPGSTRASNSSTEASVTARSTGNVPAGSRSCSRASLQGKQLNLPARAFDCRARSFEFDLLDPVGGQDGDLAALQLV